MIITSHFLVYTTERKNYISMSHGFGATASNIFKANLYNLVMIHV